MAKWNTHTIADVVKDIKNDMYVLPVIQRDLVWEENQMELLFDSLLKRNSFGGIIALKEEPGKIPLFAYRKFAIDGKKEDSIRRNTPLTEEHQIIIDGQQRLQTFYIGLKGSINNKILYFNLLSDYKSNYDFRFSNKNEKEINKDKTKLWISVPYLFEQLDNSHTPLSESRRIIKDKNITNDDDKDTVLFNIQTFYSCVFGDDTIGIAKVVLNREDFSEFENRKKVLELFQRLNNGGTKLDFMELIASTLKSFDDRMEKFLRDFVSKFADINLTTENLIKLILLLQDNVSKEIVSIDETDTAFALNNQTRIENALIETRQFLKLVNLGEYYRSDRQQRSFIPIFFITYHIFHKQKTDEEILHIWDKYETSCDDFQPIKKWLYHSLLNGVFRSKGSGWTPYKTGINKILNTLKNFKGKTFPIDELINVYINHPLKFITSYSVENIDTLDRNFIYYLIYEIEFRKNDIDHIMPQNILEQEKYNYKFSDINNIKNFQLLDYGTNRGVKNGKPFAEWVNNPDYVKDKNEYIKRHLIPKDETLWNEDKFLDFSKARGNLILDKIIKCIE